MPPAQLFISHSSREDPAARALIERLARELTSAGLTVQVDNISLQPGEVWNDRLLDWMLECHGAILLLSPQALQSDWVALEATILDLRRRQDSEFELIPVFLPGVDAAVLKDPARSRLTALDLARLQALHAGDVAADAALLAALHVKCEQLEKRWDAGDPSLRLLKDIAALLESGPTTGLERLASLIDEEVKTWLWNRKRLHLTLALARRMSEVGLIRAVQALERVAIHYQLSQAKAIVERLAPLRVNPAAARSFADVLSGRIQAAGVLLNADEQDTGKLYARRATGEDLKTRFIDLTNCNEGHGPALLEEEILEAVLEFAKADTVPDAQQELQYAGAPHFALLPARRPDGAVLQRIARTFPTLRFCCLTGFALPVDLPAESPLLALLPALGPHEEAELINPYRYSRRRLTELWEASSY